MKLRLLEDIDMSTNHGLVKFIDDSSKIEFVQRDNIHDEEEFVPPAWNEIMKMVERRENAAKSAAKHPCPECGTIQVQLVNWTTDNLKLKCRKCFHNFERTL